MTPTDHKILIQLKTIPMAGLSRLGGKAFQLTHYFVLWDGYFRRRSRRRTPMDPPPLDPSTGAKGSRLPRLAGRVNFAAQPRAGAWAAPCEEMP